ncbi:hypothetical protein IE994_24500 [Enterobacter hormaechei]|nr:hypothetical protein [Enterobacter hormaechei]
MKNSVKADLAVHGLGKESKTQTIAPLGNGRLLSLNESGEVKLHQTSPGQRRDRLPTQTLTSVGLPATQGADRRRGEAGTTERYSGQRTQ